MNNETNNTTHESHKKDNWVPANGGTETPFVTRTGIKLQYMWNTANGDHAYYSFASDMFLTDAEAAEVLAI